MKKKAIFIFSTNQKIGRLNKLVLFANKHVLNEFKFKKKKLNFKFLRNIYNNENENLKEFNACNEFYSRLLPELSSQLNNIHEVNWNTRAWEILVGPWLNRYIRVIFDRLKYLDLAKKDYQIFFIKKNFKDKSLTSTDMADFVNKSLNGDWNEKLLRRLNEIDVNKNLESNFVKISEKKIIKHLYSSEKVKLTIKGLINYFFNLFYKLNINSTVIHKGYFGTKIAALKLFFKLKEIPTKFFFPKIPFEKDFDLSIRKKINLDLEIKNHREKIVKYLLPETIPTLYIEGFHDLLKLTKKLNLPTGKNIIFTRNLWRDDLFKFWTANQISLGSKLIYGQHGAGYGMFKGSFGDFFEPKIADKFLSWGQKYENTNYKNIVRSSISSLPQKFVEISKDNIKKNSRILILPGVSGLYLSRNELFNNFKGELDNAQKFAKNINVDLISKIYIKPHPKEILKGLVYSKIFKSYFDTPIKTINTKTKISKLIPKTKITIFTHMSTEFLKNLVINSPSIYLMSKYDKKILNRNALSFFKKLEDVNIVVHDGKKLAKFINKNYQNLEKWWLDNKTQNSMKYFANEFAYYSSESEKDFQKFFISTKFSNFNFTK